MPDPTPRSFDTSPSGAPGPRHMPPWRRLASLTILATALVGALACQPQEDAVSPTPTPAPDFDPVARQYVELVLALGQHDDGYVDAFYGPEELRQAAEAAARTLDQIGTEADTLIAGLGEPVEGDEMIELRRRYLKRQLEALRSRVDQLAGVEMTFDEESKALYDAVAPHHDDATFQATLDTLDGVLAEAGHTEGTLAERIAAFKSEFVIPSDQLDTVFQTAIAACRERTAQWLELPEGESFTVEYVNDKPWSGYNWYQGNYQSLIQVNTDLPIYIDRAIDLACHEGYPGHHLYNALLEKNLTRDRGWVELSVYPLFSPQSLIAEGSANYGIEMAFPGDERIAYEKEALFPLAGIDPERAEVYYRVLESLKGLSYAGNEAARRYLDGELDADQAADWLTQYAASERARSEQRVRFFDAYRSYVINYNLGQDLVRAWVEREAGDEPEARWQLFGKLLSSPLLPSDLVTDEVAVAPDTAETEG